MARFIDRYAGVLSQLNENECDITLCTRNLALDDDIWVMEGVDLSRFAEHSVALWSHDMTVPVARVSNVAVTPEKITGRATFVPAGISPKADEVRGLVKSGVVTGVSARIIPLKSEPLDPLRPHAGRRVTKSILLECSFCSVPADTASGVTARTQGDNEMAEWKVGASRSLPIEDSDDWDGAAAARSIFEYAGGDSFSPEKARKGFLFYDADAPDKRESYKDPIAHVVDGKLVVPKGAIRAAASRLPQTDVPEDVKKRAEAVLKAYKKKAKIGDENDGGDRARRASYKRLFTAGAMKTRDLYDVSQLCYLLWQLSGQAHGAKIEAALEGDESEVPGMLVEVLHELGDVLKAMAEEEVDELLAAHEGEDTDDDEEEDGVERTFIAAGGSRLARLFRRAVVHLRAGKVLSQVNSDKLEKADGHHARALKKHRSLGENHKIVGEHLDDARAENDGAGEYHEDLGQELEGVRAAHEKGDLEEAKRCMDRAETAHEKLGEHLDSAERAHDGAKDAHADVGDDHAALGRSVRSARRCVRDVLGKSVEGEDDLNPETPTDGEKDDEDTRSRRARALLHRAKSMDLALDFV